MVCKYPLLKLQSLLVGRSFRLQLWEDLQSKNVSPEKPIIHGSKESMSPCSSQCSSRVLAVVSSAGHCRPSPLAIQNDWWFQWYTITTLYMRMREERHVLCCYKACFSLNISRGLLGLQVPLGTRFELKTLGKLSIFGLFSAIVAILCYYSTCVQALYASVNFQKLEARIKPEKFKIFLLSHIVYQSMDAIILETISVQTIRLKSPLR